MYVNKLDAFIVRDFTTTFITEFFYASNIRQAHHHPYAALEHVPQVAGSKSFHLQYWLKLVEEHERPAFWKAF